MAELCYKPVYSVYSAFERDRLSPRYTGPWTGCILPKNHEGNCTDWRLDQRYQQALRKAT